MSALAIDSVNFEIVRDARGSLTRISSSEEIRQWVQTRLLLFQGEMPLVSQDGTRYIGFILEKGTPESLITAHIRDRIVGTPGVVSVDRLDLAGPDADRAITVSYDATIQDSDLNERRTLSDTLRPLLEPSPTGAVKLIAAWAGLHTETQIQILEELDSVEFPTYLADRVRESALEPRRSAAAAHPRADSRARRPPCCSRRPDVE